MSRSTGWRGLGSGERGGLQRIRIKEEGQLAGAARAAGSGGMRNREGIEERWDHLSFIEKLSRSLRPGSPGWRAVSPGRPPDFSPPSSIVVRYAASRDLRHRVRSSPGLPIALLLPFLLL